MEANGRHRSMRFVRRDAADRGAGGGPQPDPPSCGTGQDVAPQYRDPRRRRLGVQRRRLLRRWLCDAEHRCSRACRGALFQLSRLGVLLADPGDAADGGDEPPQRSRQHARDDPARSEEHTSELQSLMRISYAVFCLKKKKYKILTTSTLATI